MIWKTTLLALAIALLLITKADAAAPNIEPVGAKILRERGGLKNTFAKLRAGQPVTIAYFGGSITAGAGASEESKTYRALTTAWFQKTFPTSKITEINAAIGGTGSDLGAFRMGYDVLRWKPDLIFIEFAVNDAGAGTESILRSMEGIIRQAWRANANTDLCMVYTYTASQQPDLGRDVFHRAAGVHDFLAEHYGIPAISVALPVARLISAGKMLASPTKDDKGNDVPIPDGVTLFANDGVHPRDPAMALYAQTISEAMPTLEATGKVGPHPLPAPVMADNWEKAKLVPIEAGMLSNGWHKIEGGLADSFKERMPEIWEANGAGESISFKFRGTAAKLYDLLGPNMGQVWVTLDGQKSERPNARFDSFSSYHRLATLGIGEGLPDGEHTVRVEIDANQPDRSSVTDVEKAKPGFDPKKYDGTWLRAGWLMLIGDLVK